ncbi:MIP/aquaporin family protein [Actinomadura atramentaria]|uniref:MIP/aquaporin family protein n=1 Tax=Actinomadura atramentaria TaxID=1990 RepID=UPI0003697F00|nr:aquaporin [Actinomadura atramentaria]
MLKKLVAEFLGTALLVYFAVGVATLSFGFGVTGRSLSAGVVATALTFGLVVLVLTYVLSPISGAHVNPAVTLGALLVGRISPRGAVGYWIAQFLGGIIGALLLWATYSASPLYRRPTTGLGADGWGSLSLIHINAGGAFLVEVILTAFFVFAVLAVTSKTADRTTAGLVIGFALATAHLIGLAITGTSVNPARSLGPALIAGGTALHQVWLFILAPFVGAVLAAAIHMFFNGPARIATAPPTEERAGAEPQPGNPPDDGSPG